MDNEIINLGHAIKTKVVTIERLSKDNPDGTPSYILLGTPMLDRNEIHELLNVLRFELYYRDKKLNDKAKKGDV